MCWTTSPLLVLAEMPNVSQIPPSALSSRGWSQIPSTEPVAILAWSGLQLIGEYAVKGSDASEAGALGHPGQWPIRSLKDRFRTIDPRLLDECRGRKTGLFAKRPGEGALGHAGPCRQVGHAEILGGLLHDLHDQSLELRRRRSLGFETRAELSLAAGAPHEKHQVAGYRQCEFGPTVSLNQ